MNKTVNINLGGMFFHIDEDAYQKLSRYFEAIKRSLTNSNGQDEIIKDIEMRIAELFAEKHSAGKQVISIRELDEVIAVMGQPEDYRIDNDDTEQSKQNFTNQSRPIKKLYRDKDGGMIGGVSAGLGHYFGIDKGEYLVHQIERSLLPYNAEKQPILLLNNDGTKVALDQSENQILSSSITAVNQKFVLTFPREVQ